MASHKLEIVAPANEPVIITRRLFDAPRALIFDAWTTPEHLKRWWGPVGMEFVVCEVDLRVGGSYRFVHRTADGQEFGFHGEFRELVRPERIVSTFVFELAPENEALETLELTERDGRTTAKTTTAHKIMEARDGHLGGGRMEAGMTESYARLDALLAELQQC